MLLFGGVDVTQKERSMMMGIERNETRDSRKLSDWASRSHVWLSFLTVARCAMFTVQVRSHASHLGIPALALDLNAEQIRCHRPRIKPRVSHADLSWILSWLLATSSTVTSTQSTGVLYNETQSRVYGFPWSSARGWTPSITIRNSYEKYPLEFGASDVAIHRKEWYTCSDGLWIRVTRGVTQINDDAVLRCSIEIGKKDSIVVVRPRLILSRSC